MPGGDSGAEFYLELQTTPRRGASVKEQSSRRRLPAFCLERHINDDSTFCLYFGSENRLKDAHEALAWWASLGSYLVHQGYAENHAVWPLAAGLSHGTAAREQLEMEALAKPLGWKDDILRAMFRGKGWLAETLPKISKARDRVVNARSPCPRGCTHKHKLLRAKSCEQETCYPGCRKAHKPILRVDCPNRTAVDSLIIHEHQRRILEARIIKQLAD